MRTFLFAACIALLSGCAERTIAAHTDCDGLASEDDRVHCMVQSLRQEGEETHAENAGEERKDAAYSVTPGGSEVADAGPVTPVETTPRDSLQDFKYCLTVAQTPIDQFTCLKDLKNR